MGQGTSTPLEQALADIESAGSGSDLDRTQSVQRDIDSGVDLKQALKAQVLRAKLREVDADVAELRASLRRWDVLAGPSKNTRVCDEDCLGCGCGEEVPDDQGLLCEGCQLFLCNKCFGQTVIRLEVEVGGR